MQRIFHRHSHNRGAASAVELAIVLPILLLLGFGGFDLGRAAAVNVALSNAARVGADWAATHRVDSNSLANWQNNLRTEAELEMESVPGFDADRLTVEVVRTPIGDGTDCVSVTAQYPYSSLLPWPGLRTVYPLRERVVVRRFR